MDATPAIQAVDLEHRVGLDAPLGVHNLRSPQTATSWSMVGMSWALACAQRGASK